MPWPPIAPIRVIIDTDTANEVDDQWAVALALGFPERLKIEGFVAAHYGQHGGAKGIEKSRKSLEETLAAAGTSGKFPIKNGSDPFTYRDRVPESEGVDFILEKARGATPQGPFCSSIHRFATVSSSSGTGGRSGRSGAPISMPSTTSSRCNSSSRNRAD